jgi:hypothetical protein
MAENIKDKDQELKPVSNSEISIDAMISSPLVAASKANSEMMLGQTNFYLRNCFKKNKDNNGYDPIMITMSLKRSVIDNNKLPSDENYIVIETMNFEVPLFCLIPINSLAVDKITVDFDMEVTSTYSWTITEEDKKNTGNRVLSKQAQLNGKISGDSKQDSQYKRSSASILKVHINASPLPLPLGVLSILELYSKNIIPVSKT